jgi:phosphatidate cytidylyltransferase
LFKVRVISAAVGIALLVAVILSGPVVFGIAMSCVAMIGLYEFYKAVHFAGFRPVRIVGYIFCLPLFLISFRVGYSWLRNLNTFPGLIEFLAFGLFIVLVLLFSMIVFLHKRYNISDIALTLFGPVYVAFLFSFLILTRNFENGMLFVILIFIGAWGTDTFAYFTGMFAGKRKVLPAISPKKTVEGTIGGVIGTALSTVVYGIFAINKVYNIPLYHFVLIGALNGVVSQIGDWGASAIKRYAKIKDYGGIMPGHGGVLDRFDSILFTAPIVYFYYIFVLV